MLLVGGRRAQHPDRCRDLHSLIEYSSQFVAGHPFCYDRGTTLQTLVEGTVAACDGRQLLLHFPHKPLRGTVPVPLKGKVRASSSTSCGNRVLVRAQVRYFS